MQNKEKESTIKDFINMFAVNKVEYPNIIKTAIAYNSDKNSIKKYCIYGLDDQKAFADICKEVLCLH